MSSGICTDCRRNTLQPIQCDLIVVEIIVFLFHFWFGKIFLMEKSGHKKQGSCEEKQTKYFNYLESYFHMFRCFYLLEIYPKEVSIWAFFSQICRLSLKEICKYKCICLSILGGYNISHTKMHSLQVKWINTKTFFSFCNENCIPIFHSDIFGISLCDILLQFCHGPSFAVSKLGPYWGRTMCFSLPIFFFIYNTAECILMHFTLSCGL